MTPLNFDDLLLQSIEDQHFSRNEKQLLKQLLQEQQPDEQTLANYRRQAFETARASLKEPETLKVLDWLEEVVKTLQSRQQVTGSGVLAEAYFAPDNDCPAKIAQLISGTKRKMDICVFTITDDRISRPILEAHRRGVAVRILTDDEKLTELGSDIESLSQAGVPIRIDRSQYHMHHKFALFDEMTLLTGSYNWTRGAAQFNKENFIVTNEPSLLRQFSQTFEKLWNEMTPF